jgi:N-glycosylase/DNA lyase
MTLTRTFQVQDYNLDATLDSGQAFRWSRVDGQWLGIVGARSVKLRSDASTIIAETAQPNTDWGWLANYLQINLDWAAVVRTFPNDSPMTSALNACRGLRLLRQDPWECLASFLMSSTKQIVQIKQIISLLCQRFGEPMIALPGQGPAWGFPTPARIARCTERELRECKMGFRAPYLLETARLISAGQFTLEKLADLPVEIARGEMLKLPGVGRKIADCVLLFAYGFQSAFPVDVWVMKALQQLYFPRRRASLPRLHKFAATHFGPWGGYAQQYLFHYMRTAAPARPERSNRKPRRPIKRKKSK